MMGMCCCQEQPLSKQEVKIVDEKDEKANTSVLSANPAPTRLDKEKSIEETAPVQQEPPSFVYAVKKKDGSDTLGLDVRHLKGELEVKTIIDGAAVTRENKERADRNEEQLQVGDRIRKVNEVSGNASLMVNEIKDSQQIIFHVVRLSIKLA
eukprot:gnl/TRDRNA2_/TRDRNA2_174161_c0_seq3.p1 gnl/TRDRNA2_/TRDRNA2_174161_c0~~gnl/TRDRNA2_/TRDRNA2_174161_c0_seq3.p1  ORF type:complete len:152 (+),score=40.35 gnl/TRDRNA2_/TRDRNA2_174161_c0_seq3:163-618(+)